MNIQTLERCFSERVGRETGNIVGTVKDKIQNAILSAIDNIITPRIELVVKSMNASSRRDAPFVPLNSEREERIGNTDSFDNVSGRNNTLHASMMRLEETFRTR